MERAASALSLLEAAFIISAVCADKKFHRSFNRPVFYGYFVNVMTNIGTLISTSGVISGSKELQSFPIQMYDLKVRVTFH
jgi:hypothetical protein